MFYYTALCAQYISSYSLNVNASFEPRGLSTLLCLRPPQTKNSLPRFATYLVIEKISLSNMIALLQLSYDDKK